MAFLYLYNMFNIEFQYSVFLPWCSIMVSMVFHSSHSNQLKNFPWSLSRSALHKSLILCCRKKSKNTVNLHLYPRLPFFIYLPNCLWWWPLDITIWSRLTNITASTFGTHKSNSSYIVLQRKFTKTFWVAPKKSRFNRIKVYTFIKLGSHCAITCDNFEVPIAKCDNIKNVWYCRAWKRSNLCINQLSRLVIAQCEPGLREAIFAKI